MRTKTVAINGKQIVVKEQRISEIKNEVIPRITGLLSDVDLQDTEVKDIFGIISSKLAEFFPSLSEADIEEAYPSEIEELIQAYIEVNFSGLKKILLPVLPSLSSLIKAGLSKQQ